MKEKQYLACEKNWVYYTLIAVAGFWGAYTYTLKGNIFCNAQTGNVVLMSMALGSHEFMKALYYVVPISAYIFGSFISELLPNPIKHHLHLRWDTLLMLIEILVIFAIGLIPHQAPVQISQVAINFIASMQYNTFRQAQGVPIATTFATNHIRQIGIGLAKEVRHWHTPKKDHRLKLFKHAKMLFFFVSGATIGTYFSHTLWDQAIWLTIIPLSIIFFTLLYADLYSERDYVKQKPSGH